MICVFSCVLSMEVKPPIVVASAWQYNNDIKVQVGFKKMDPDAIIPKRATDMSAGYDLYALEERTITGGEGFVLVPTGIAVKLPADTYGRVAPRSGLAFKEHLTVGAGVIDRDYYPGKIGVLIACVKTNHTYTIKKGERCAQLVIERILAEPAIEITEDSRLDAQTHVGFGSTGK